MVKKYRVVPIPLGGGMDPSTKYGANIAMSLDQDYVLSVQLLDQDGNALGNEQTVDLPLESVVVNGSYDSQTKSIILTLENGNEVTIPVGDLVSGLQTEITAQNPLSADLVADGTNNKVFTDAEQTKLSGIETGAQVNVNADWNAQSGDAQILNKPSIPANTSDLNNDSGFITINDVPAQVNADWNASSGAAEILNKPTIPAAQVNSDWNAVSGKAEILNKPSIPSKTSDLQNDSGFITSSDIPAQVQADWNETGSSQPSFIKNKPTIPAAQVNSDWNATSGIAEILHKPSIPANTSDLNNDSGFITANDIPDQVQSDWNETDISDPAYIKNKPSIPASQVNSDWNATSGKAEILNKPSIPSNTSDLHNDSGFITASDIPAQVNSDWNAVSGAAEILNKPTIPTVNDATLTVQKNGTTVGTFTANQATAETINIIVPTSAADVSALPASTKYAASMTLSVNTTTYVVTAQLKDQDGNNLGTAQTIDLPLESVVVNGSYDSTNKKIVLTLQNGTTIDIPVADLVSGLQSEITAQNPLNADYLTSGTTNKVYTATEQSKLSGIEAGAQVNVKPDWNAASGSAAEILNKPTIPAAQVNSDWNASTGVAQILNKPSIPANTSDLNNDSGFITGSDVPSNQTQANWSEADSTKPGYIRNKPSIPAAQVNADWNASSGVAQILNKPTIPAAQVNSDWNATSGKAEILNKPTVPTATSQLNNDSGFITLSDVPAQVNADWNAVSGAAQIINKPTIPAAQVNADWSASSGVAQILNKPTIPSKTSDLNNDSGFITISDVPSQVNADWNSSSGASQILNKPTIPAAQVNSDWAAASGISQILNKPSTIAVVVTFTDQTTATYNLYHS